jgi:hypothetical protein
MLSVNSSIDTKVKADSKTWSSAEKKQIKQQTEWNINNRQ